MLTNGPTKQGTGLPERPGLSSRGCHRLYRTGGIGHRDFRVGEVRLNGGKLGQLVVQFVPQGERFPQTWLIARQPGLRVDGAAALLQKIGVHPVKNMLQPGDQPGLRRLGIDADRLGKIRPF